MDLHAPEGPIHSLKDFVVHLCVVTVGILIALGLEQLVESHHRARLGSEAVEGFRRELADDRNEVQDVLAAMPALRTDIDAQIALLSGPVSGPDSGAKKFKIPGLHFNSVSAASWDTAVVTQGVAQLPYDTVKQYAQAYSLLRLFLDEERVMLGSWHDMFAYGEDVGSLTVDQRRELVERLHRYASYTYTLDFIGKGTLKACEELSR